VARKKRQALDNLLTTGRISQPTHDMFNKEIEDALVDIEKQQKVLLEKMAAKVVELEGHVRTLEILLANFEIRHVTGEIGDETYQRENELLSVGLETAKRDLEEVKDAANQLAAGDLTLDAEIGEQPEVKFLEEAAPEEKNEEPIVETVTITEASPAETEAKAEEKAEA
jgi:hypothetical protein